MSGNEARKVALQQIKVQVADLRAGMYVSSLDRPWIDTPFPLQGFYIVDYRDIDELKKWCNYVYVDVERGNWPAGKLGNTQPAAPIEPTGPGPAGPKAAPLKIQRNVYAKTAPMKKELKKVERMHEKVGEAVDRFMRAAHAGKQADVAETRHAVNALVSSVIRNPDALVWLSRVKRRDRYAYDHSVRSAVWALVFGRYLGLSQEGLENLALGVLLAEVGKTRLPKELLVKPVLSPEETEQMKRHVDHAVKILKATPGIDDLVIAIVAARNERFDGSGYPRGLKGDQIPYLAKIAGLVDRYDGMLYPRNMELAMTSANAMTKLYELRDVEFQEELIHEFIQAIGLYPAGTLVELSTQEVGVVMEQHLDRKLRPKILLVLDSKKRPFGKPRLIDLLSRERTAKGRVLEISQGLDVGAYKLDPWKIHQAAFGGWWAAAS
ncbi:MAG: DUF3391 domain-containing protein [Gammaproteobacteria bacterium]|nr:DUF3391 domain-containing protein [Gammaproteobacteria bacterium]NIR99072.1 DUF3391 domain-containing protein [Gammaproteobacteria bacterium]NIT64704.1 DUF3391 domain-containing protein [Gammaproteobacteria bacterium]NIV21662.1 DUF3391 domain-containing protein [Gammaproteobacteria bacterium]NIX10624.1 DUF3391 domain-containing protein [Gammaproteobacteria bacterium]